MSKTCSTVLVGKKYNRNNTRVIFTVLTDPWLTCDHFVGKASAMGQPTRPTQPSIPLGSVNE